MRQQIWYVAALIGVMGVIRFTLAAIGYFDPHWLMTQLSIRIATNIQMPYIIRVWAIRDIVLSLLVVFAARNTVKTLLLACVVIDLTDVLSAQLSGANGLFNAAETWSLQLTAIAALVPELMALAFLAVSNPQQITGAETKTSQS